MSKDKALMLAIEALKTAQNNLAPSKGSAHAYGDGELWDKYANAIKALEALAQPEQEPVYSLLDEKKTDKWESARVADYNSGWNDCRKTMLASSTKPVLEIVNGQINRSWDAIPEGFTGMLYTTPPQRKPLTDEEIAYATAPVFMGGNPSLTGIARAIEAAHGIKGEAS